jgi:hypothetical protein
MLNQNTLDLIATQLRNAVQPEPFQRQHYFYSILAHCGEKETSSARMDMMYRFKQIQKCLSSMLRGDLGAADELLESMQAETLELGSAAAQAAMEALHSSMAAYRHYVARDYEQAFACLERSRQCNYLLHETGLTRVAVALIDLDLNEIRVQVASKQIEQAIGKSVEMLKLLYSRQARISESVIDYSTDFSPADQDSIDRFVTDAVITKLLGTNDHSCIQYFFSKLCATIPDWAPGGVGLALQHYADLLSGADSDESNRLFLRTVTVPALPLSLQYLLVCAYRNKTGHAASPGALRIFEQYFGARPELEKLRSCSWCDHSSLRNPTSGAVDEVSELHELAH